MLESSSILEYPPVELFLSSIDGIQQNSKYYNDVLFQLPRTLYSPDGYQMYLQVLSFTIPHSWHVVNELNNVIVIGTTQYTLQIGNYSIQTLCSILSKLQQGVSFTFSNITLKVTVTSATTVTLDGSLLNLLGIPASSTPVSSVNTCDMTSVSSIYVLTDYSTVNANIDSHISNTGAILTRIPVVTQPGQVVQFQDFNGRSGLLLQDSTIKQCRIGLESDDPRVGLQCTLHWDITLQVSFVKTGRYHLKVERPLSLQYPPDEALKYDAMVAEQ